MRAAALLALLPPMASAGGLVLAALSLAALHASAQAVPLPAWARSGQVNDDGAVVYVAPSASSARRGTVALGTRVPMFARVGGEGCSGFAFVQLGPEAFVCERDLTPSSEPPSGRAQPLLAPEQLLPFEYLSVKRDATFAYASPSDHLTLDFAVLLGKRFGVAVSERVREEDRDFVRTHRGYYVQESQLSPMQPSEFAGVQLAHAGELDEIAWVVREPSKTHALAGVDVSALPRLSLVRLLPGQAGPVLRVQGGGQVLAEDLARPRRAELPADLSPGERFVDVDTATQIVTVYEGATPLFSTLASTGEPFAHDTPKGAFRIWAKLATSDMSGGEEGGSAPSYSIERVPWVQYFHEDYALHAAFWHDRYGEPKSHGCVNLSPRDARTLFALTSPALPDGWYAILTAPSEPGTRVIVR